MQKITTEVSQRRAAALKMYNLAMRCGATSRQWNHIAETLMMCAHEYFGTEEHSQYEYLRARSVSATSESECAVHESRRVDPSNRPYSFN